MKVKKILSFLRYYSTPLLIFGSPFLFMPIPVIIPGKEALAAYMLCLMAVYWCSECIPLGITSLLPLFMAPLFEILTAREACNNYMEKTTLMLTGGMILALAVEKCNLHKRVAIKVLMTLGTSPRWLMLGFMLPTWFLSMWISNTAAAAMMMPMLLEVIDKLYDIEVVPLKKTFIDEILIRRRASSNVVEAIHLDDMGDDVTANGSVGTSTTDVAIISTTSIDHAGPPFQTQISVPDSIDEVTGRPKHKKHRKTYAQAEKDFNNMAKALILGIPFAASCGGIATLIGTGVNPITKATAEDIWSSNGLESPVNFVSWMIMGIPSAVLNVLLVWLWLGFFYIGPKRFLGFGEEMDEKEQKVVTDVFDREYKKLGNIRVDEIEVACLFCLLVGLWFFRAPDFIPGWGSLLPRGYADDAMPAMLVSFLLFCIPAAYTKDTEDGKPPMLLDWKTMKGLSWDVILLLGGGMALASTITKSGLATWIGTQLTLLQNLPEVLLVIIMCFVAAAVTQVTSNVAAASLMMPIVSSMAQAIGNNPLFLMFPVAMGVQYAYLLPVGTPPNAVAFTSGRIKVFDMVIAGTVPVILGVLVSTFFTMTWGMAFFNLSTMPWEVAPPDGVVNNTIANATAA